MAQRRMFSRKIIDSARFMKMPISSQLLYFHLGLRADDDGIVEAFNVIKLMGSGEDDLRVLVSKGFVKVLNEDLVTFICDWREHNKIRSDRKIDSMYKNLLLEIVPDTALLESRERADKKKSTIEFEITDDGQQLDDKRTSSGPHRIGKVRLGKVRLVKDIKSKTIEKDTNISSSDEDSVNSNELTSIINSWNALGLQNLTSIKGKRATMLKGRLKEYGKESIYKCIGQIRESPFLKGQNNRSWVINFDWLIKPTNYVKVLEGNYREAEPQKAAARPHNPYKTKFHFENDRSSQYSEDELEKQILESQKKKFEKGE